QYPDLYIALGELKGGIDPAGADEHWKTARTALQRIDDAFRKISKHPYTFFIGAAIETKMAREIYRQLETKKPERGTRELEGSAIAVLVGCVP
ncbi:MAG: AvaI/BsoBI family type II restriction endonuclease, partial [Microcystis sp.]